MKRPVEIPIDGTLDLHTFRPKEVASLVREYIEVCLDKGIYEIRIIHGKGKGVLRSTVHHILEEHPMVVRFHDAHDWAGWGATVVYLRKVGLD